MKFEPRENLKELPIVSVHLKSDCCLLSEKPISKAKEAIEFVADKIYDSAKENAIAIFFDNTLAPICVAYVGSGDTSNVRFSARDIVQTALLCNATYVTILHNHPEINIGKKKCEPSREDVLVTDSIIKACSIVGVKVYDSIITSAYKEKKFGVTKPVYYSLREHGYNRICKKFGVKDDVLPNGENDITWEFDENYYTKDGEIPDQRSESQRVSYRP